MKLRITEEIWKEGEMYVSYCPELDISSCGEGIKQAQKNLQEVIHITLEETKKMGTFKEYLEECGFEGDTDIMSIRKELVGFSPIEIAI